MKPLLLSWWLLCGADAASTHYILNTGGREVVLPTQNPWVVDGIVIAEAAAVSWALSDLHKTKPKTAMALGIGLTVLRGAVVAHNLHAIAQHAR